MKTIAIEDSRPTVRIANYIHPVSNAAWPERALPDFELIYVADGAFSYQTADDEQELTPGQVLVIKPGLHHSLVMTSERGSLSCIHGELWDTGSWHGGDYRLTVEPKQVTTCTDRELMHGLFRRCSEAFEGYGRLHEELARTIAKEIWLRLAESWHGANDPRISPRMAKMVAYLRQNLCVTVGRADLAAEFHLTPEHINWLFKKHLGMSPTQFVNRERVLRAYRLIQQEGMSVKEAAARVGYNDPFYFSRLFTRIAGVPPSEV